MVFLGGLVGVGAEWLDGTRGNWVADAGGAADGPNTRRGGGSRAADLDGRLRGTVVRTGALANALRADAGVGDLVAKVKDGKTLGAGEGWGPRAEAIARGAGAQWYTDLDRHWARTDWVRGRDFTCDGDNVCVWPDAVV